MEEGAGMDKNIIKLYLITGFLGSGKTTFLKNFIQRNSEYRFKVIVNEFGKEGIDGLLIKESGVKVDEISNGSIFCSCRLDQFENALSQAVSDDPDIILVEASGLSDPTGMEKILDQVRYVENIQYMGSICLIDAVNIKKVLTAVRVSKKQIAASDLLLINKSDLVTEEVLAEAKELIMEQHPGAVIYNTTYGQIEINWLENLGDDQQSTPVPLCRQVTPVPLYHTKDIGLQKMLIKINDNMTFQQLRSFLNIFIEDTLRIKGFVKLENTFALVNGVGVNLSIEPYEGEVENYNSLVSLAGANMPMEKSVKQAVQWYPQYISSVE